MSGNEKRLIVPVLLLLCALASEDRNYEESKKDKGNIRNNKANRFEIALFDTAGMKRNEGKAQLNRTGGKTYGSEGLEKIELKINGISRISYAESGTPVEIGIRGESSATSYAGDDLLLTLEVENRGKKYTVKAAEKDYIAMYDKKLLWRANLYIDKGTTDWNNEHPWAAPADSSKTANAPEWWSTVWGYNEWNKPDTNYSGTAGGQVVIIPSIRWNYGINKTQHTVEGTVAYDHQGWDNPFSYREKMRQQSILLNQWYTASKEPFNKGIYDWTTGKSKEDILENTGKVVIAETATEQEAQRIYDNYMSDKSLRWASTETMLGKNSGIFFEKDETGYNKYIYPEKYGTQESPYVTTSADNVGGGGSDFVPTFIEGVKKAPTEGVVINGETIYPYVPGLSDSLMTTSKYPHKAIGKETAGVDCIGFVQSSYAWEDSPYSAINSAEYRKGPVYWTSSDSDIPSSAMRRFYSDSYSTLMCEQVNPSDEVDNILTTESLTDTISIYDQFENVVPGDVVYYPGQHIMIVSEIKAPSGPDGRYVDRDIVLIESVYSNQDSGYYGVVKRSLKNETTSGKKWEIRRQK